MTPDQLTLLQGILRAGDEAPDLLMRWCSTTNLDTVDGASHKLLPLLFRGLSNAGLEPAELDRLRGVYRKSWYRNQQHVAAVAQVAKVLQSGTIPHAVVGGLALAMTHYEDLGARTVQVSRLVVPAAEVGPAVDAITKLGFRVRRPARLYGFGLPTIFVSPSGVLLDVRDWTYGPGWPDVSDPEIWDRRRPLEEGDLASSTLDATDALVLAAAEGAATPEGWLQGVVDVAVLIRNDSVDWAALAERYGSSPLLVPLHEAVAALVDDVGIDVGSAAAQWHRSAQPGLRQRAAFFGNRNGRRLIRLVPWYRNGRKGTVAGQQAGFGAFAAAVYGVDSLADAAGRVKRRIAGLRS